MQDLHNRSMEIAKLYLDGLGTTKSYIESYIWFNVVSSNYEHYKSNKAKEEMKKLEKLLPIEKVLETQ